MALPRSPTTAVLVWGVGTAEIGIANGIVTMVGIGIGIVIAIGLDLDGNAGSPYRSADETILRQLLVQRPARSRYLPTVSSHSSIIKMSKANNIVR